MIVQLSDDTGMLTMRFFTFSKYQAQNLSRDTLVRCYGKTRKTASGIEMIHPQYQVIDPESPAPLSKRLTPVYPTTKGLSQTKLRQIVNASLKEQLKNTEEILPDEIIAEMGLGSLRDALSKIHRPLPSEINEKEGFEPLRRLVAEELIANQLALRQIKKTTQSNPALALSDNQLMKTFIKNLPFKLTGSQKRVVREIEKDLAEPIPMMRLLQGDVGSGKTVVAAAACTQAVANDVQAAIMAPTELLAEQHWASFRKWFDTLGVKLAWLSGSQKQSERRVSLEAIGSGNAQIVIGTHALFQEGVEFSRLGLIVIDEQHRFGVHQRVALRDKGRSRSDHPHQLVMTATPIPRTLAMAAYADLDTSIIDELPPGRHPVSTVALPDTRRSEVIERLRNACQNGQQAYWVCPLIDESDVLDYQAAEANHQVLTKSLDTLSIGLVHGRMKNAAREKVMSAFKSGDIDVLVATTIIEVGVDVPNASLMIIENPERLGLAQLHQLRGRVGRGSAASHCVLLYHAPLSALGRERLGIMRESTDGFVIAEKDLALRGPGEVLGTRQTGVVQFRVADLVRDADLLPDVQQAAQQLARQYPDHVQPLLDRWIAQGQHFAQV